MLTNKEGLKEISAELQDAAQRGDRGEVERQLKDLRDFIQRRVELGRELADQVDDPVLKKQILDACNELERLLPLIEEAARYAAAHPDDPAAQKRLQDLLDQMNAAANRITGERVFDSKDPNASTKGAILDSSKDIDSDLNRMRELLKDGNYSEAEQLAKDLQTKAKRQVNSKQIVLFQI